MAAKGGAWAGGGGAGGAFVSAKGLQAIDRTKSEFQGESQGIQKSLVASAKLKLTRNLDTGARLSDELIRKGEITVRDKVNNRTITIKQKELGGIRGYRFLNPKTGRKVKGAPKGSPILNRDQLTSMLAHYAKA
jgi:hypothetical protein